MMLQRRTSIGLLAGVALPLLIGALALAGCGGGGRGAQGPEGPEGPPGPGGPPGTYLEDGLSLQVTSVTIGADLRPVVLFTLADREGGPCALADLDGNPAFLLAWIDVDPVTGYTRYQNYVTNMRTGNPFTYEGNPVPPALASAAQAGTDSGGSFETLAPGSYRYTFGRTVPADYLAAATHTLGAWATREGRTWVANALFHFVPAGGPVTVMRQVVATQTCNECHFRMTAHGGTRREVGLCVLCHTDQTIDPESGNSVEFEEMIHRIHHGANLPVKPYYIVGYGGRVFDFSETQWTQDTRNCERCHKDAPQAENWKKAPSRTACGSCHNDIDWVTGANHPGGVQGDDIACKICHSDTSTIEFDRNIPGAHVVPYFSSSNPNLQLAITNVRNLSPGMRPEITFTITDKSGPRDIATLESVRILIAATAAEYRQVTSFTVRGGGATGVLTGSNPYTWLAGTSAGAWFLPMDAAGTWAVGMESRTNSVTVNAQSIRFGANNPVAYVDVTVGQLGMGTPTARRQIIDEDNCKVCHQEIRMHGGQRTNPEYCVMCHNTWNTDANRRPGVNLTTNPPESINFRYMVHKIHRGADLQQGFTVYGFGNTAYDFSHVQFPGDLRNCKHCHLPGTYGVPTALGTDSQVFNVGGVVVDTPWPIRPPASSACTACHDSPDAMVHAQLNSFVLGPGPGEWGESCAVCHGAGSTFDVEKMHEIR